MKNRTILVSLLMFSLFPNVLFGQNLSLIELIDLRNKSLTNFKKILNSKAWTNNEKESIGLTNTGGQTENTFRLSNKTHGASIEYITNNDSRNSRISIHISQKETYSEYVTKIISLGYKLIKAEVENGDIVKVYQNKKITIKVTTITDKTNYSSATINTYKFLILSNEDYGLKI